MLRKVTGGLWKVNKVWNDWNSSRVVFCLRHEVSIIFSYWFQLLLEVLKKYTLQDGTLIHLNSDQKPGAKGRSDIWLALPVSL